MEACGGAHHWARQLSEHGFQVKLIPPQFVTPYVKSNKNDANDAENKLTHRFRRLLNDLWRDLSYLEERIAGLDIEIREVANTDSMAVRLQQLRGVGPLIATALIATVGNGSQFTKGRQMAASIGLTPKQHSSGGKDRLLGISKRGDAYLRTILIHGARSTIAHATHREDRLSVWVTDLAKRSHTNVAAVALANKTVRMAWAMMKDDTDYDPERAVA
jgi:transposase